MNKLTKITLLFIVCTLFLSLVACSSQTSSTENESNSSEKQSDATSKDEQSDLDFVTVSFYLRRPIDNMSAKPEVEAEVNKYLREQLNCEIEIFPIDVAAFDDKMRMMSGAGEAFDIVMTTSWTNSIVVNVANGTLLPLDDLLNEYGQDILAKNDPNAWKAATFNGKIMMIPGQTPFAQPSAFCFKAELVDKYEIDYRSLNSLEKLESYFKILKENEPNITPLYASPTGTIGSGLPTRIEISKGIVFDETSETIEYAFDDEEQIKLYELLVDYYKKEYIAPDALVKTEVVQEIKTGTYGVFNDPGGYTEDGSKSSGMYGFKCYETLNTYPLIQTNSMLGAGNAISATSENPDRAMMVLNLFWADRYLSKTMAYGVEGKNYEVISGDVHDPSIDTVIEATSGEEQTWAIWHNWVGPLWDQWSSNWNTTEALQKMQEDNNNSTPSKLLGYIFEPEPVKQEIAQLNAIWIEASPILTTGTAPDLDQYLDELSSRMDAAGGQKVMDEIEKQIAEWKANK